MKKLLSFLFALCATFSLTSCAVLLGDVSSSDSSTEPASSVPPSYNSSSLEEEEDESDEVSASFEDAPTDSDETPSSSEDTPTSSDEGPSGDTSSYLFTDFTADEKSLFMQYIGVILPFIPTNEYCLEGYYEETDYENGIYFCAIGNTEADFEAYRKLYSDYTLTDTYYDDYNDLCYCYEKEDVVVDMSYYLFEGESYIDVYVYSSLSEDGGNTGGDYDDSTGGGESDVDLITNKGKGLPKGVNGVYNVDFTKATHVKNVTEQSNFLNGCPTTSSPAVLVIPVEFSNATAASKGYSINKIKTAFTGGAGTTDYYSVHDYYYTSSYGKLDLDITVVNSWFKPKYASTYYQNQTMDYYGDEIFAGDQMILDEALAKLSTTMDLSKFDSDENGFIDSVVMINTLDVDFDVDFQWAYRFWNLYTDSDDYYYEYDNVCANDYLWASYQFLHESMNRTGSVDYTDTSLINTYTYIHEFGHILGADDYYDTAYVQSPLNGYDVMDAYFGDHNPYTKFNYGWLTTSRLVVANDTLTLSLEDFSKNGDTIIIANNWDESLGAYQEYYVLMYYKNTGLNGDGFGYFEKEGVLVYHVNASLYKEMLDGETYYAVYNTNTNEDDPNGYGTKDNLIEFVLSAKGNYVYGAGDRISATTKDDQGNKIAYTFTVDSLTSNSATITFKKNS